MTWPLCAPIGPARPTERTRRAPRDSPQKRALTPLTSPAPSPRADRPRSLFFRQEMELSLVGLQNAGKVRRSMPRHKPEGLAVPTDTSDDSLWSGALIYARDSRILAD